MSDKDIRISVLVCAKNSAEMMPECLQAIRDNDPDEIIVVDGDSTDGTADIARSMGITVISDHGRGFGYARRIGMEATKNELVAIVSPDNILPKGCLAQLAADLQKTGWVAVEAQVRVLLDEHSTYWDRCWDLNLRIDLVPGERAVVGNPSLYQRDAVVGYKYDDSASSNDDSDLCERWRKDGLKVGVGNAIAYEKQRLTFPEFRKRWTWYGDGDARFVWKYRHTPRVAIRHLFHPLKTYIIGRSIKALLLGSISAVPFFVLCGVYRYKGFFKTYPKLLLDQRTY